MTAAFDSFNAGSVFATSKGSVVEVVNALVGTPPPTFQPAAGTYASAQTVAITDTASGALICYTTDGSTPVAGGSNCTTTVSFKVNGSETVRAIAAAPGYAASSVASAIYVINIPPSDFTLAVSPSTAALSGQSATATVSIGSVNGFTQSVSFACSGLQSGGSCSFSPAAVVSSGSTTLTVTLPTASARLGTRRPFTTGTVVVLATALMGCLARRRRSLRSLLLVIGCVALTMSLSGCGKSSDNTTATSPPPSHTQTTVTVTATSGSLVHAATLTLESN